MRTIFARVRTVKRKTSFRFRKSTQFVVHAPNLSQAQTPHAPAAKVALKRTLANFRIQGTSVTVRYYLECIIGCKLVESQTMNVRQRLKLRHFVERLVVQKYSPNYLHNQFHIQKIELI